MTDVKTVMGESALYAQVGGVSLSENTSESTSKHEQETVSIGISYAVNDQVEIFGSLGEGEQIQEGNIRSDSLSVYKVGFKFVPRHQGKLKMGISVQAEQVDSKYKGNDEYNIRYFSYETGARNYYFSGFNLPGKEEVNLTVIDLNIGFSYSMGVVTPYFGLFASTINGDYSFSSNTNVRVTSYPVGGGVGTTTTENLSVKLDSSLTEDDLLGGVLGLSIRTIENFAVDIEYQGGARDGIFMTANYTF